MYAREEHIPEENLDWEKTLEKGNLSNIEEQKKEDKHIIHPNSERSRIVFKKKVKFSEINIKSLILNTLDQHGEVTLFFSILTLPISLGL